MTSKRSIENNNVNKQNIPKLRFPEFSDDWDNIILNDVAKFSKGKSISKNDISEKGLECVRYGELYTKYDEIIDNVISRTNLDENKLVLSNKNDILIPCSGETAIDLATASCVTKDHVAIGGDITIIKTNQYAPFIAYYLNQKKNEIAKYAQGVSVVHLYAKDFKSLKMKIPSISEQEKIISFMEKIAQRERLLEQKYEYFIKFKKYLLQNIFSQKLRFEGFEDEWKSKKLGDFVEINSGKSPKNLISEKGKIPYFKVEQLNNCVKYQKKTPYFIDKCDKPIPEGSIIFPKRGAAILLNKIRILCQKSFMDTNLMTLTVDETCNNEFIYYFIQYEDLSKIADTTSIPQLNNKHINPYPIKIPTLEEQNKIAKCLSSFDQKINLLQDQISHMEDFKKGLLQSLFI